MRAAKCWLYGQYQAVVRSPEVRMCRFANTSSCSDSQDRSCHDRDRGHNNGRINFHRFACLPTIIEAADEGKVASESVGNSKTNIRFTQTLEI